MRSIFRQFRDTVAVRACTRKVAVRASTRKVAVRAPARKRRANDEGLTLVEMIVVLAIIALVAALIVPNVINRPDQARVVTAGTDLKTIGAALKMYRLDNGDYPTTAQGLKALVEKPTASPVPSNWVAGGYLPQMPVDPWGNPYVYAAPAPGGFALKTFGKDGKAGGEGLDADIVAGK